MPGKIQIVVGGQFGSEGKGHACAELAKREGEMLAVRTGGPNAGHTVWGNPARREGLRSESVEFKLRQVPVAVVVNPRAIGAVAPRSLVQLDLAEREVKETGISAVFVDPNATILEPAHVSVESADETLANWSTQKGIGAARIDRLHRTARTFRDRVQVTDLLQEHSVTGLAREYLTAGKTVQIEAAQGYGLGLHTEFYPKTTSADCRAIDALADLGVSPWEYPDAALEIWLVIRPHPIRVAGESGPLKHETTWEALGLPQEHTTVTNKVRRVGAWDPGLVAKAVRANGTRDVKLWMNMADHVFPWLAGRTSLNGLDRQAKIQVNAWLDRVQEQVNAPIRALGTGPDTAIFFGEA